MNLDCIPCLHAFKILDTWKSNKVLIYYAETSLLCIPGIHVCIYTAIHVFQSFVQVCKISFAHWVSCVVSGLPKYDLNMHSLNCFESFSQNFLIRILIIIGTDYLSFSRRHVDIY